MAKLLLRHVYKIYDNGTKAVNDFNLEIGDEEFVVFVGPSGCGKSTTLRMISGLEDITAGDFYIDGQLANQLEPKDRDMAMVFQNYALYPHMSVYENMAFGLKIRHIPKDEINRRVHEAAQILDITNQLTKKPKAMSGGQRQRVALGRAIVRKPKVFLLDEPLSNLDAKLRSSMRSEIIKLHNTLKTTFIYVTHDQVEAMTMGSKIVVMKDGVIQQVDSPMNLYDYPSNVFVAGFIGTPQMNFFRASLKEESNEIIDLTVGDKVIKCPRNVLSKLDLLNVYKNKEVKVGIRPEHLYISETKDNCLTATINIVEALGNECNLIVETKEGIRLVMRVLRNDKLAVGQEINVGFDFSKVHLFDLDTEKTLLPRIATDFTYRAVVKAGKLNVLGHDVKLCDSLKEALKDQKNVYVRVNSNLFSTGNEFSLPIINKEKIGELWLNELEINNEKLFIVTNEYFYGDKYEFSLKQEELEILDSEFKKIVEPLKTENIVNGKLVPEKRTMSFVKNTMVSEEEIQRLTDEATQKGNPAPKVTYRKVRLFDYELLGQLYEPNAADTIKVYSLLGKKFHLHDIKFSISVDDIKLADSGVSGTVNKVLDYGTNKYYVIDVNGEEVVIKNNDATINVGDNVYLELDASKIGVFDTNFEVKLL